jgi:hypothetical protein
MPAPTLDVLFAFEHAIESAWQNILSDVDNNLTPYIEASDTDKQAPYADIQLQDSAPETLQQFIYQPTPDTTQITYYSAYHATLITRVVTVRGKNSDRQAEFIGKVRLRAGNFLALFTTANLPYHGVLSVLDRGMRRGVIVAERLDWAELHHQIKFCIRTDAWPIS